MPECLKCTMGLCAHHHPSPHRCRLAWCVVKFSHLWLLCDRLEANQYVVVLQRDPVWTSSACSTEQPAAACCKAASWCCNDALTTVLLYALHICIKLVARPLQPDLPHKHAHPFALCNAGNTKEGPSTLSSSDTVNSGGATTSGIPVSQRRAPAGLAAVFFMVRSFSIVLWHITVVY